MLVYPQRTYLFKQILERSSQRLQRKITNKCKDMNFDFFPLFDGVFSLEYPNIWNEMHISKENFGLTLAAESIKKLEIIFGNFSHFVISNTEKSKTLLKILTGNEEFNKANRSLRKDNIGGRKSNAFSDNAKG